MVFSSPKDGGAESRLQSLLITLIETSKGVLSEAKMFLGIDIFLRAHFLWLERKTSARWRIAAGALNWESPSFLFLF